MADTLNDPSVGTDEFAQTRGADDLFDDEIVPISGEQQIQHVDEPPVQEPSPTETAAQESAPSRQARAQARDGSSSERGRGRGARARGRGGRGGQDVSTKHEAVAKDNKAEFGGKDSSSGDQPEGQMTEGTDDNGSENKPAATSKSDANRVQAVRGDRSGTGGIRKPKLTEEELAERMAAAKLNAAKRSAAHARAEADVASFNERERIAAEKRRQEALNRKAMDNERERNRMRKLGAQTGREWDAEKKEEGYSGRRGGGSQYRRGMHGGVAGTPRRESNDRHERSEESPGPKGRGRGRGGRGRGRVGRGHPNRDESQTKAEAPSAPGVDNESEFPSLPGSSTKEAPAKLETDTVKPAPIDSLAALDSPAEGSWADQVDSAQNT